MTRFSTLICTLVLLGGDMAGVQASSVPPATTSRYVNTVDRTTHYNEGCAQGTARRSGIVILDFGQPWRQSSGYGTYLVTPLVFVTISQIQNAVESYLDGFYNCSSSGAVLRLAVGTNNYSFHAPEVTTGHAKAWAAMINHLNAYTSAKGYASQEYIRAASDMELDWNSASTTRAWLDAYGSATQQPIYDYGDAAGCPPYGSCDNGWTQGDVYYVSYGQAIADAAPEIYTPDGGQADEWFQLSLYGYTHFGKAMQILLPLTQSAACGCGSQTNTPAQAYAQLETRLNGNRHTAQTIPYASDLTYAN